MWKFMGLTFLGLGVVFYHESGGADFEPELRSPVTIAQSDLAPAVTPDVARADTSSLLQIAAPTTIETPTPAVISTVGFDAPLPAGEIIITPAPAREAATAEVIQASATVTETRDLRIVAGDRVRMRAGPGTNHDILDTLSKGTQAEVLDRDATGWARIRLTNNGQEGWMAERLLSEL